VYAVCAGILVADIFCSPIDALPDEGQLKLADSFLLNAGGCAVNTAACLRRIGRPTRVIGKVGRDLFGDFVVSDLARLGIDPSGIKRSSSHPTSTTFILNVKNQDRRYVHLIGANGDLRPEELCGSALEDARVLYVGGYLAMPAFDSLGLAELFKTARKLSVKTVLDVIIAAGQRVDLNAVRDVLPYTDMFLPNEDEARALTGEESVSGQAEVLARLAPECTILITRGRRGVFARRGAQVWQAGTYAVETVDESGAGDAFAAGVVAGMVENWPLEFVLKFASAMGASCTRALGCTAGVFTRDEALAFVESMPLEIQTEREALAVWP
jgi:sugar/nucleoside kinase (ribokinase family)